MMNKKYWLSHFIGNDLLIGHNTSSNESPQFCFHGLCRMVGKVNKIIVIVRMLVLHYNMPDIFQ